MPKQKHSQPGGTKNAPANLRDVSYTSHNNYTEISASVLGGGVSSVVAVITGPQHAAVAELIVDVGSKLNCLQNTITELTKALSMCLACNGDLTWEAEQEADILYRRLARKEHAHPNMVWPMIEDLTRREIEILSWTARGKSRKEVSVLLSLSENTVKDYYEKIQRKLNAANKTHAVSIAAALGKISLLLDDIRDDDKVVVPPKGGRGGYKSTRTEDAPLNAKRIKPIGN